MCVCFSYFGRKKINFFVRGEKKLMKKVVKNRYFVICVKFLLENMNSNEGWEDSKRNLG